MTEFPHISVVIPTCDRPADARRCLESLAHVSYPAWDVLVADQSDGDETRSIVEEMQVRIPHLAYRRLNVKGTSRARNAGVEATSGDIIAFLDDDCSVAPDWLARVADVATRYPDAGQIFGDLRPAGGRAEWSPEGWTPARVTPTEFEARVRGHLRNRLRLPRLLGNGACLFVRRETAERSGPFDLYLGPGARFPSSEDGDYTYRALMAGYSVVGTPAIVVEHHGMRDYQSGAAARLGRAYPYGAGAWLMKLLRAGDPFALVWIAAELWRYARLSRPLNALTRRGPTGMGRLVHFAHGAVDSFQLGVDRKSRLYRARTG